MQEGFHLQTGKFPFLNLSASFHLQTGKMKNKHPYLAETEVPREA
jgi:hypothetical protein